jgi:predicted SAM-dependent methyltransferase
MRLHIGGSERKDGWVNLGTQPAPHVDIVGNCCEMRMIQNGSVDEVYASHVLEHLGHQDELPRALAEILRVLRPSGRFMISVPDLAILAWLLTMPHFGPNEQWQIMTMMFGGQHDPFDFHKVGFTGALLTQYLAEAGFVDLRRCQDFGLFDDTSTRREFGIPISLNMEARKPG